MRYIDTTDLLAKRANWGHGQNLWENGNLKRDFRDHFHGKCWYTEAELDGDDVYIDHFRPKGEVKQYLHYPYNVPLQNTGYNWLRNDEKNYRACCVVANRITAGGGKGAYFPLQPGSPYLTQNGNEDERPLLLDPCCREDVRLLSFFGNDVICTSLSPVDAERVEASKVIYNLKHFSIEQARSRIWESVAKTIEEYEADEISETSCIRQLTDAVSPRTRYSACAIACVNSLAPDNIKNALNLNL